MNEDTKSKLLTLAGGTSAITLVGGGLAIGGQAVTAASFTATDESSLADAIVNANASPGPDTITIGAGTITLTSTLPDIVDEVTIVGAGQGVTILDGAGAHRIFRANEATMLTVSDMTLQNGRTAGASEAGAAVDTYRTSVTLDHVTVSNNYTSGRGAVAVKSRAYPPLFSLDVLYSNFDSNSAWQMGAVYAAGFLSSVTINHSTFTSNSATIGDFDGAIGIYCVYGYPCAVTLSDSEFAYNTAASWGGVGHIYAGGLGSTVTIERSTFKGNSASGKFATGALLVGNATVEISDSYFADNVSGESIYGGALSLTRSPSATITDSTFTRNSSSDGSGGAIHAYSVDDIDIADSTFSYNDATFAGALYVSGSESVTIENTTFNSNSASNRGGAINAFAGTVVLDQSTWSGNAGGDAGAMRLYSSSVTIRNATIASNISTSGGVVQIDGTDGSLDIVNTVIAGNTGNTATGGDLLATGRSTTSIDHSLIGSSAVDVLNVGSGNIVGVDPELGAIADNGGTTATMEPLPGSPLIDAGDSAVHTFDADQRGESRLVDAIDIGAVEARPAPPETTTVPDTTVPDTTVPDTSVPDTTVPDTTVPITDVLPPTGGSGRSGLVAALVTALGAVLTLGASRRGRAPL